MGCCIDGGSFCKSSIESEGLFFDFVNRLGTRTIVDADAVLSDDSPDADLLIGEVTVIQDDVEIDADTTVTALKAVAVQLSGGTAGGVYGVIVTATLDEGSVLQQRGLISIES